MKKSDVVKIVYDALRTQHSNPEEIVDSTMKKESVDRQCAERILLARIVSAFSFGCQRKPMMIERFEDLLQKRKHKREDHG